MKLKFQFEKENLHVLIRKKNLWEKNETEKTTQYQEPNHQAHEIVFN